jgi:pimeloyl-ACP methyl ester carboxylesterase
VHSYARADLSFDVLDAGPLDAQPVVLLHGFPATRLSWEAVVPTLVGAGYRVLAPDQRGYSPGAQPTGRRAYRMGELVDDVLALGEAAGTDRFHLVGHDWGGAVAWALAAREPQVLRSLTVIGTPHPRALQRALSGSTQALRSSYMLFFQLPWLPERVLSMFGARLGAWWLTRSGLAEERALTYLRTLGARRALTPALAWYRALPFDLVSAAAVGPIPVRTLYVWPTEDVAFSPAAAEDTARWVTGSYRFEVLTGVSHWVPEAAPDALTGLLVEHLSASP